MNKVIQVKPLENYQLAIVFETNEKRLFDMAPYLEKGIFTRLKEPSLFQQAFVAWDTVCWPGELDISPDTLYLKSKFIEEVA